MNEGIHTPGSKPSRAELVEKYKKIDNTIKELANDPGHAEAAKARLLKELVDELNTINAAIDKIDNPAEEASGGNAWNDPSAAAIGEMRERYRVK